MMILEDQAKAFDLADAEAVEALTAELGITREQLHAAIAMIDHMPRAIRFYFASKSRTRKTIVTNETRTKYESSELARRPNGHAKLPMNIESMILQERVAAYRKWANSDIDSRKSLLSHAPRSPIGTCVPAIIPALLFENISN